MLELSFNLAILHSAPSSNKSPTRSIESHKNNRQKKILDLLQNKLAADTNVKVCFVERSGRGNLFMIDKAGLEAAAGDSWDTVAIPATVCLVY